MRTQATAISLQAEPLACSGALSGPWAVCEVRRLLGGRCGGAPGDARAVAYCTLAAKLVMLAPCAPPQISMPPMTAIRLSLAGTK